MSIEEHEFADEQVYSVLSVNPNDDHIWLNISDEIEIHITKDDVYALAKHFGLIDEWVSMSVGTPTDVTSVKFITNDGDEFDGVYLAGARIFESDQDWFRDFDVIKWKPIHQPPKEPPK